MFSTKLFSQGRLVNELVDNKHKLEEIIYIYRKKYLLKQMVKNATLIQLVVFYYFRFREIGRYDTGPNFIKYFTGTYWYCHIVSDIASKTQ